jgi:hypothetical protein
VSSSRRSLCWLGATPLLLRVERRAGGWTVNGAPVPDLGDCVDLDFGFTPATNTLQIRRTVLSEGESADVAAAWLDVRAGRLERLNQRYKRLGQTSYWYTAPRFDYTAVLEVNELGLVVLYPNLWEAET